MTMEQEFEKLFDPKVIAESLKPKPQTNFQRITESEEVLAEWLDSKFDYCQSVWCWQCDKCKWDETHEDCLSDKDKWLEWLKQESTE